MKYAQCSLWLVLLWLSHRFVAVHLKHYDDVRMCAMASQITSLTIVHSSVYSGADQIKHQSSTSLAFVRGIHRWPVLTHVTKTLGLTSIIYWPDMFLSDTCEINVYPRAFAVWITTIEYSKAPMRGLCCDSVGYNAIQEGLFWPPTGI